MTTVELRCGNCWICRFVICSARGPTVTPVTVTAAEHHARVARTQQRINSLCSRPHCVPSGLASFSMNADGSSLPATQSQLFEGRDNVRAIAPSHPVATTSQTYECSLLDEALRAVQGLSTFRELILMLSKVSSSLWLSLKCTDV